MKYVVTFYSRTNAVKFYDSLRAYGAEAGLINTPAAIRKGCGLSVKGYDLSAIKHVLSYGSYNSFHGIYESNGTELKEIY